MPLPSARDNLHSRMVVILKVTLPLIALALLSSLFLFSRGIDPEDAIPYAEVEIADRLAEPRMTGAGFSTMTSDGAALTVAASEAVPGESGATARGISGRLDTPDGAFTEITASTAALDNAAGILTLSDGVSLRNSLGYVIAAEGFTMTTDRSGLQSRGAVTAEGPLGQLSAGSLRLERAKDAESYLLVFNEGVRLLYQPKP
jgi:lipopolysaccharide export system protein LptC